MANCFVFEVVTTSIMNLPYGLLAVKKMEILYGIFTVTAYLVMESQSPK